MPNFATRSSAVETAAKCLPTASLPSAFCTHLRAVSALVIVSTVVKVFEAMMNSVVSADRPFSVSWIWAPSMLET